MILHVLKSRLAVCRLAPDTPIPDWAAVGELVSITRTADELSVVCSDSAVPLDINCERGWVALKIVGPLDFSLTGILASVASPLAEAAVSIFSISTYDTDYVLVKENSLGKAVQALSAAGHTVLSRPEFHAA